MKFIRLFFVLLVLSTVALCQSSPADEPATKEDVLQMFKEMHFEQQMQAVMGSVAKQMGTMIDGMTQRPEFQKMTDAQKAKFKQLMEETSKDALQIYPISEIINDYAPIYAKYLTKSDIQSIAAFYRSPAGRKMLDNTPKITQEGMAVLGPKIQSRMNEYMDRMQQRIKAIAEESENESAPATTK